MKKVFTILTVAAMAVTMAACGNGATDNNATDNGGNEAVKADNNAAQESLAPKGTFSFADEEYSYGAQVLEKMFNFSVISLSTMETVIYSAPYTYDASSREGSADMKDSRNGSDAGKATFTYDPESDAVTVTFQGKTVTLTKPQAL